jgi:hypothetical protein
VHVDLAGRATVLVADPDDGSAASLEPLLDPYVPEQVPPAAAAGVVFRRASPGRLLEIHRRAQDGLVTGWDGTQLHVLDGDLTCGVLSTGDRTEFLYDRGFPLAPLFRRYGRLALQLAMWPQEAVCVHGSGVVVDGRGVLVAGWSESGKTETALALMERGARFVSDKWTIVGSDRSLATFPIGVGIRRWVLSALPRLRGSLPRRARGQFAASAAVDAAAGLLRPLPATARARRLVEQAVLLADRAALQPSQLLAAYGDERRPKAGERLALLVLLTTVEEGPPSARRADPEWAAARLAASAAYERRFWFELGARCRYSSGQAAGGRRDEVERREREFLLQALDPVPVLELRAPFPTDPRPLAELVLQEL